MIHSKAQRSLLLWNAHTCADLVHVYEKAVALVSKILLTGRMYRKVCGTRARRGRATTDRSVGKSGRQLTRPSLILHRVWRKEVGTQFIQRMFFAQVNSHRPLHLSSTSGIGCTKKNSLGCIPACASDIDAKIGALMTDDPPLCVAPTSVRFARSKDKRGASR